jgi:hypothetical protein
MPATAKTAEKSPARTTALPVKEQKGNRKHLLLGILVWFLEQNLVYQGNSVACKWAWLTEPAGGLTKLQWLELGISVVALVILLYLVFRTWQAWRRTQGSRDERGRGMLTATQEDRGGFMAFVTMGVNMAFVLFSLGTIVIILGLNACGQA